MRALERCGRSPARRAVGDRFVRDDDPRARWLCLKHWYRDYLRSRHWEKLRERKLRDVGRRCERCGRREGRTAKGNPSGLNVHHKSYDRLGHEELTDLEVLCTSCHEGEHGLTG